jgi:hypothetical protein
MCNFIITDFSCGHATTECEACTKKSFPYTYFHQCTATEELKSSRTTCPECRRQRQGVYLRRQPRTIEEARALNGWQPDDPTRRGMLPSPFLQHRGAVHDEGNKPKPPPMDMEKKFSFMEPRNAEQDDGYRPKPPPKDLPRDSFSETSKEDNLGANACKGFLDGKPVSPPVVPSPRAGKANCTSFAEEQEDFFYSDGRPTVIHTKEERAVLQSTRAYLTIREETECFFEPAQQPKCVQTPPRLRIRKSYSRSLREQFQRANTTIRKENELFFDHVTSIPSILDTAQRASDHSPVLHLEKEDTTFQAARVAHIPAHYFFRHDTTFQATKCNDIGNNYAFRRHSNPNTVATETSISGIFELEGTDMSEMSWLFERATRAMTLQEPWISVARKIGASRSYEIMCPPVRGQNQASEPQEPAITSGTKHISVLHEVNHSSPFSSDGKVRKLVAPKSREILHQRDKVHELSASKSREAFQGQQYQVSEPQEFVIIRSAVHAPVLPEIRSSSPISPGGSFGTLVPSRSRGLMRGLRPGRQADQVSQAQAISCSKEAMQVSAQRTNVSEVCRLATCNRPLASVPVLPAIRPVSPLSFEKILAEGILNLAARKTKMLSSEWEKN